MRQAAAERAPQADRIVRDVLYNSGKHRPERAVLNGTMECGVARSCTDVQDPLADGKHVQPGDGVDVDQMCRTREAENHDRYQALAARQHPAVLRRQLRQQSHRLRQGLRPMVGERCGFHQSALPMVIGLAPARRASSGASSCEWR